MQTTEEKLLQLPPHTGFTDKLFKIKKYYKMLHQV